MKVKLGIMTWCYLLLMLINYNKDSYYVNAKSLDINQQNCHEHVGEFFKSFLNISIVSSEKLDVVLNGFVCFGLAYAGCNVVQAVIFLTLSLSFHGAVTTGVLASMIDNTPNFSGIFMGISSMITIITGMISPIVVGYLTFENQTVEAWQHIFEICAVIMIISGIIFILFNDSSLQEWNKPPKKYESVSQKDEFNLRFSDSIEKKEEEIEKEM